MRSTILSRTRPVLVGLRPQPWFLAVVTLGIGVVVWWAFAALAASGSSGSVAVNGRIAWKSFPRLAQDTWSIYAANPDGSHRRRLTHPAPAS